VVSCVSTSLVLTRPTTVERVPPARRRRRGQRRRRDRPGGGRQRGGPPGRVQPDAVVRAPYAPALVACSRPGAAPPRLVVFRTQPHPLAPLLLTTDTTQPEATQPSRRPCCWTRGRTRVLERRCVHVRGGPTLGRQNAPVTPTHTPCLRHCSSRDTGSTGTRRCTWRLPAALPTAWSRC
jgi:hypothetical protein